MAAYKVINLDSPIESDYWVDIPVRDPATNKDAVDEEGRILVERHVTRSVKNEEMSTINAAVETVNTLKVDYSTFKEEVSTKVNTHDSNILTNTNNITTLTDSVANHDLQINALYSKINAIQGIDIDDFKYVTETDIKNIKKNYLPLTGGTVTGDLVLSGKVSSSSPIKANLQGTADRAIGDTNGKALTSYIANLKVSGASITVTNGAGTASNYIVDNINHATHANSATNATNATNATHATLADSATKATNCTSKVNSSLTTNSFISGNQGNVLVNSNASAGAYTMLTKLNSTNGKFTQGCYKNNYLLQYTTNATVNAGTNSVTKSVTLLNENGDSTFCGVVTAPTFKGALSGNATTANSAINANRAKNADSATTAINASHAAIADHATNASHATSADRATNATNANHATSADNATRASSATNANNLGGYSASNYVRSVNGVSPNSTGNVQLDTGEIKWFAFNRVPNGYLVCNGAKVSRETYADLYAIIGTTFGSGDGSTTFALPNLIDKFIQGSTTVGTVKSAGLPNITGNLRNIWGNNSTSEANPSDHGAIQATLDEVGKSSFGDNTAYHLHFNASLSNSIYGNSSTVQPPALTLLPCIKY